MTTSAISFYSLQVENRPGTRRGPPRYACTHGAFAGALLEVRRGSCEGLLGTLAVTREAIYTLAVTSGTPQRRQHIHQYPAITRTRNDLAQVCRIALFNWPGDTTDTSWCPKQPRYDGLSRPLIATLAYI
jgi:hypothetical protein